VPSHHAQSCALTASSVAFRRCTRPSQVNKVIRSWGALQGHIHTTDGVDIPL
jgi:hypothetical protein